MIINKAYLGDITATNIYKSLPTRRRRKPAGINMEQNYFTVTLCILSALLTMRIQRLSCPLGAHKVT